MADQIRIGSSVACPRCGKQCRVESHNHAHCSQCFSGFRTDIEQIRIGDSGELEPQPLTWDGEPLYSQSTIREGLFDATAFEQLQGQTALGVDDETL